MAYAGQCTCTRCAPQGHAEDSSVLPALVADDNKELNQRQQCRKAQEGESNHANEPGIPVQVLRNMPSVDHDVV